MRPPLPGRCLVCLVTDRRRLIQETDDEETAASRLVELVAAAARAGVDLIQVRERDLDARPLAELVARCVRATENTSARIIVNDRVDVALTAGAAGVHLRADSPRAGRVRTMVPPAFLVGRSVHGANEAVAVARQGGLDYLILGTVFPSASKDPGHTPVGIGELARAVRGAGIPVFAIGGITLERAGAVARVGAAGIAAIGLFAAGPGMSVVDRRLEAIVGELHRAFDRSEAVP